MDFGTLLLDLRKRADLNQDQFANKVNAKLSEMESSIRHLDRKLVGVLENGWFSNPHADYIDAMVEVLELAGETEQEFRRAAGSIHARGYAMYSATPLEAEPEWLDHICWVERLDGDMVHALKGLSGLLDSPQRRVRIYGREDAEQLWYRRREAWLEFLQAGEYTDRHLYCMEDMTNGLFHKREPVDPSHPHYEGVSRFRRTAAEALEGVMLTIELLRRHEKFEVALSPYRAPFKFIAKHNPNRGYYVLIDECTGHKKRNIHRSYPAGIELRGPNAYQAMMQEFKNMWSKDEGVVKDKEAVIKQFEAWQVQLEKEMNDGT